MKERTPGVPAGAATPRCRRPRSAEMAPNAYTWGLGRDRRARATGRAGGLDSDRKTCDPCPRDWQRRPGQTWANGSASAVTGWAWMRCRPVPGAGHPCTESRRLRRLARSSRLPARNPSRWAAARPVRPSRYARRRDRPAAVPVAASRRGWLIAGGAFAVAAVWIVATGGPFARTDAPTASGAALAAATKPVYEPPTVNPADASAEEAALGFVDAFATFDAQKAMTYVNDEADLTGVIDAQVPPNAEGLSLMLSRLKAVGYNQTVTSCETADLGPTRASPAISISTPSGPIRSAGDRSAVAPSCSRFVTERSSGLRFAGTWTNSYRRCGSPSRSGSPRRTRRTPPSCTWTGRARVHPALARIDPALGAALSRVRGGNEAGTA